MINLKFDKSVLFILFHFFSVLISGHLNICLLIQSFHIHQIQIYIKCSYAFMQLKTFFFKTYYTDRKSIYDRIIILPVISLTYKLIELRLCTLCARYASIRTSYTNSMPIHMRHCIPSDLSYVYT